MGGDELQGYKGKRIINEEVIKQLIAAKNGLEVRWIHTKGHSDDPGNERADQMAREALLREPQKLLVFNKISQNEQREDPALRKII